LKLSVEVEVRPTESVEKVKTAVKNIFPTIELQPVDGKLVGESADVQALEKFHQRLRLLRILGSARSVMFSGRQDNTTRVMLNKQAAFAGKVSFTDGESPLGPIVVAFEAPDIEHLIDYLAPRTKDGKPVQEIDYP
jgi:hypothetical protein